MRHVGEEVHVFTALTQARSVSTDRRPLLVPVVQDRLESR